MHSTTSEIKPFRVTDGGNVAGQFRTLKNARYYLANSQIFTRGQWLPLGQDGFYIERFDVERYEWKRA